jgi:hypothetical protein
MAVETDVTFADADWMLAGLAYWLDVDATGAGGEWLRGETGNRGGGGECGRGGEQETCPK